MADDARTDAEIIVASRERPAEFASVFDRHYDRVHQYVARRLGASAADDLASEVFTVAITGLRRYDPDRPSALPWLYGIAANLVHGQYRAPRRARRAVVATTAAALVVAVVVAVLVPPAPGPGSRAGEHATLPKTENVDDVLTQLRAALPDVAADVVHVHTSWGNGYSEDDWQGPGQGVQLIASFDPDGRPDNTVRLVTSDGTQSATVVDYADRSWWTWSSPVPTVPASCVPAPLYPATTTTIVAPGTCYTVNPAAGGNLNGIPLSPTWVKGLAQSGSVTLGPTQQVDGHQTIQLVSTGATSAAGTSTLWVDTSDYLVVRATASGGVANAGEDYQSDATYLPPTTANLAKLGLVAPAGFTHLSGPPPDLTTPPPGGGVG